MGSVQPALQDVFLIMIKTTAKLVIQTKLPLVVNVNLVQLDMFQSMLKTNVLLVFYPKLLRQAIAPPARLDKYP
jgi:hypothetical protein